MLPPVLALSSFALCLAAAVSAQEPAAAQVAEPPGAGASRERALDKTRELLERQPGHAALFDRYFKLLIEGNAVDAEVDRMRAKLEADPEDRSAALVLGRLLLRAGKEEQALEVLDDLVGKGIEDHEVQGVLGAIYFKLGRFDAAGRAYTAALDGARTAEAKRTVIEKIGHCQLAMGNKEQAIATWQRIAELDGGKFFRVVRVAELLTEAGLLEEAAAAYAPLLAESEDDVERHCRVLRDYGRLQELRGQLDEALATYEKVMQRTARGNWLRKAVEERTVQIYRRTGRLEQLAQRLAARVEEAPDDLPAVELYADVLVEMRELKRAAEVLAAAAPSFPKDVRLARRLAELWVELEDLDKAIAEYQRILSERPEQLELYLELGTLFARSERFEAAKNQWEKALAQNLKDATLCARIASMYALWERHDDAVRLYERAIELQPDEMTRYTDLAAYLRSVRRPDDARVALQRALEVAHGAPRRLEVLVGAFREYEMPDRARACLDELLQLEPNNFEARYGLAQLLLETGERERAVALLWEVVDGKPREQDAESAEERDGSGYRTQAANTLVNLAARAGQVEQLIADAKQRQTAGAAFVLGRALSQQREFEDAVEAFALAVERDPTDLDARRLLARMLASEGDYEAALEAYRELQMVAPGERQRTFREVARLHLEMYDTEQAVQVWKDAMRLNPDNWSVFLTVGKELMDIQRIPEALEAFQQALRLKPGNPDVQFRLAAALQRSGKLEEAEQQYLQIATSAAEHRDRDVARESLFQLYAEQGRIDDRIGELQAKIEENVYDPDAPQLLADIYLRSHDYVLGLQLLEKCLHFQPRNKELLARRAELLEALEEWQQALAAHEQLLEFPDADRDLHLSGIGRSLYELGRAEEAKKVFAKIRDRGRVSDLYEKYRLYDEAIEYWQREVARHPGDVRGYRELGQQLANRNRSDEAIAVFERALDVRPFDRLSLNELGKLYVQTGRREDAVRVGRQLFGLRGEGEEKTREQELAEIKENNRWSSWNRFSIWNSFSAQRLSSAQQFFTERGLQKEWADILLAEARKRPTNLPLFQAVQSLYGWQDRSAKKMAAYLTELLQRDLRADRMPPGYTVRAYRQMVENALVQVWQQDAAVAGARLAELSADEASAETQLERAVLLRSIGKTDEMVAALRAAIAADADAAVARLMLVEHLVEKKEYAEAVTHLRALAAWWGGPGAAYEDELEARKELAFRSSRRERYQQLPRRVRRRVTDELLREVDARVETEAFGATGASYGNVYMGYYPPGGAQPFHFPELTPRPFAIGLKLIAVLAAMEAPQAEIDAAIDAALQQAPNLGRRAALAGVLFTEKQRARAEPLLEEVMREIRALHGDALQVYFWSHYQGIARTTADHLAQILAEKGRYIDAYRLLTEFGDREKAEGVAREHGVLDEVAALLQQEVEAQAERLRQARAGGAGTDLRAVELDYRDAVIQHATLVLAEKDYASAEEIYGASLDLLPNDIQIREVLAQLQLRRGDAEAAVATHYEIIEAKRRERRAAAGEWAPPPTRLQPALPNTSSSSYVYYGSGMSYAPSYMYTTASHNTEVSSNYHQILQIWATRNEHTELLDALRRILTEDPTVFRSIVYTAMDMLKNQDLGIKKLPILRMFRGYAKERIWMRCEYAEACKEAGELQEAERTLEEMLADATDYNDYYVQRAGTLLEQVRQKLGKTADGIADLRTKIEAEPDNVRHRLQLAELLKKKHDHAGVLEQASIVAEKAPYMTRAKTMVVEAAAAAGDDDTVLATLRELFADAKAGREKMARGVALANWLFSSGQEDEAFAIIDGLETDMGGSDDFMPSGWYLDRHEKQRALEHLRGELDRLRSLSWYGTRVRPRLARIEMATGHEADALERYLESIREAGSLPEREQRFKELLAVVRGHPDPAALEQAVEGRFGKRETVDDLLVMASCAFARGDAEAGERELAKAVEISPKEVYLFPLLLGLERQRAAYGRALALLDRMEKVYGGSEQMQWSSGVSVSEKDRLKVERAIILRLMDRPGEAEALINSLADETQFQSFQTVASLWLHLEEYEKALEWQTRYAERVGSKDKGAWLAEANLLLELGRLDEALAAAESARRMAPGDASARARLIQIHRARGTLASFAAEIEAEHRKDPRDRGVRSALIDVWGELGKEQEQRAVYEALLEIPEEREAALRVLVERARDTDDFAAAIGYQKQLIELAGGQEKKRHYGTLAGLQLSAGDVDGAQASYAESLDLDTSKGLLSQAQWLLRMDRREAALDAYRKAVELDPDEYGMHLELARDAKEKGEMRAALDHVVDYSMRSHGKAELPGDATRGLVLDCLAALDDAARQQLLEGGDDVEGHERAALLHYCRGDMAAACRHARAAIDAGSEGVLSWQVLHAADDGADLEARLRILEGYHHRLERENAPTQDYQYQRYAEALQSERALLLLELGRPEEATEMWRRPLFRRANTDDNLGYYRSDWRMRFAADKWLAVEEPELALRTLEEEFLVYEQPPWRSFFKIHSELGHDDLVESRLWPRVFDPLQAYNVGGGSPAEFQLALVDVYDEHGRDGELLQRIEQAHARPETEKQADELRRRLAQQTKDYRFAAEEAERDLAESLEKSENAGKRMLSSHADLAQKWALAKDWAKARAHLEHILDLSSPELPRRLGSMDSNRDEWTRVSSGGASLSATNPFSLSLQPGYGGYSYTSSSNDLSSAERQRQLAITALLALGETELARRCESALLERMPAYRRAGTLYDLAASFRKHGLHGEAARALRAALAIEGQDEDGRARAWTALAEALELSGDAAARRAVLEQHRAELAQQAAKTGEHALAERLRLVDLAIELEDWDAAERDLAFLERFAVAPTQYHDRRGLLELRRGDCARAAALLDELRQRGLRLGQRHGGLGPQQRAWLGLALAGAGGGPDQTARAKELLRDAADTFDEDHRLGREVRAALASLQ